MKKLIFLLAFVLMIASVSALFPSEKLQPSLKEDLQISESANVYPALEIKDWLGLGETKANLVLTKHTSECSNDCMSEFQITTYQDSSIIDEIVFLKDGRESNIRSYNIQYFGEVTDYIQECNSIKTENGTFQDCKLIENGSHKDWINYNLGDKLPSGTYDIKLTGSKRSEWEYDWQIKTQGVWTTEWSVWGAYGSGNSYINLTSPADGSIQYSNPVTTNTSVQVIGGSAIVNISQYDNSTGSWALKNFTNVYETINFNLTHGTDSTESASPRAGLAFNVTTNQTLTTIEKANACTADRAYLYEATSANNGNLLATQTYSGNVATFNYNLSANKTYFIVAGLNAGTNYVRTYSSTSYPQTNGSLIVTGYVIIGSAYATDNYRNIQKINIKSNLAYLTQTWNNTYSGTIKWGVKACDSDGVCGMSENRTFSIDTSAPTITINYPVGNIGYGNQGLNVTLNYSISDSNVNVCWFEYNSTNSTIPCAGNSSFLQGTSTQLSGKIWANDTIGNTNYSNVNWSYGIFDNGVTYTSPILVGETNSIIQNVTTGTAVSVVYLNYSNTYYIPSITAYSDYSIINTSFLTPYASGNIAYFNYIYTIGGTNYTSSTRNQTTVNVNLSATCGTYPLVNITNYDEEALVITNGTVEYIMNLTNNNIYLFSINGTSNGTNLCLSSSINLSIYSSTFDLQLRYYGQNYAYKTYNIQDLETSETPFSLNLYFLNSSLANKFTISYTDFGYLSHPNALVQIQRQYINQNIYHTVEQPIISQDDIALGSFNTNNVRYKIVIIENGLIIDTFENLFPICQNLVLGTCELNLRGKENISVSTADDLVYTLGKTNNSLIFTFNIPSGIPKVVEFYTNQSSRFLNSISNCNNSIFASSGTITCNYNITTGNSVVKTQITIDGVPTLYGNVVIEEDLNSIFFLNNYFISFVLILSLVLMFISSGTIMLISVLVGLLFCGLIFLVNTSTGLLVGSIAWLIIVVILAIYKIGKKEETT